MNLSFGEIADWRVFEALVAAYFRGLKQSNPNIVEVKVQTSGEGNDGGRDILVTIQLTDSFTSFRRIWVVQCKFNTSPVGKAVMSEVNIPSLIHEYKADGYLLVCKGRISSRLSDMFEHLNDNCRFRYQYDFWDGEQLKDRLTVQPKLLQRYFPEYYEFLQRRDVEIKI